MAPTSIRITTMMRMVPSMGFFLSGGAGLSRGSGGGVAFHVWAVGGPSWPNLQPLRLPTTRSAAPATMARAPMMGGRGLIAQAADVDPANALAFQRSGSEARLKR